MHTKKYLGELGGRDELMASREPLTSVREMDDHLHVQRYKIMEEVYVCVCVLRCVQVADSTDIPFVTYDYRHSICTRMSQNV